ncbi:MAG TPA: hypothetical protein VFN25_10035 [Dokdonella sp.]|uniref:hypothetical protein n=1 Tax=Dokdonella sp. TaxID=2291710 RepID=UPI002D7F37BD|nr:hypothetical protein [Dokdonella sp.]HET9033233.1 hypothetical protein [Dokdonella sp.]
MRFVQIALPLLLASLLTACGIEVPPAKSTYIGQWKADGMSLLITQDGSVSYKRMRKGASTKIDAPLKAFHGDDFEVGLGPMVTTFKVTSPPHKVADSWRMTVDGVELTRVAGY